MAVIKAINSKSSVSKIINYVADRNKTSEELMYGKDCSSNSVQAIQDMKMTKEIYNKEDGRQYKHFVQSFNPKDDITPQKAYEIGKEWSEKNFNGYEVFMATHTDKEHIHNHFIVNTVNFETGEKYRQSIADLERYKETSNKICEREGLTPTELNKKVLTSFNNKKYKALERCVEGNYKSYMMDLWKNINSSVKQATNRDQFIGSMKQKGYEVNWSDTRKYITFTTPEGQKVRNSNLAKTFKNEKFTKEGLENEFRRNREESRRSGDFTKEQGDTGDGRSSTGNKSINSGVRRIFAEGNRHIEGSPVKFGRGSDEIQRTDRERERGNNSKIQRDGRSSEQADNNNSRGLLETTTTGIKESTGNNEVKQIGNGIRNKADDRKVSSEGRDSILTKDSNNIFNSRIKSTMPGNIQSNTSLDNEIKKQIKQNNEVLYENDKEDKKNDIDLEKNIKREKDNDRER